MREHYRPGAHGAAETALVAMAVFSAGSILLLWLWNSLAVDPFQLSEAHFKNAVAFGGLMAGAFLCHAFVVQITLGGPPRPGHRGEAVS